MTEELKDKLLDILIHFKTGLDDIEEGSGERQPMQDEIDFALPLVKKLIIADVIVPKGTLFCDCEIPKPIDPFEVLDKSICSDCKEIIN